MPLELLMHMLRVVAGVALLAPCLVNSAGVTLRTAESKDKAISSMVRHHALGAPTKSQVTNNILDLLGKFKAYAEDSSQGVQERHQSETLRLLESMKMTKDAHVRQALNESLEMSDSTLQDTTRVFSSITKFVKSLEMVLSSAKEQGQSCEDVDCGANAGCTQTTKGAQCVCKMGFVGDGKDCTAPENFVPRHLLLSGSEGAITRAAEVNVAELQGSKVVVVWRDLSHKDQGRLAIGIIRGAGRIEWGTPEKFSGDQKAYDPVVVGNPDGSFAVAWRDQERDGTCWLRGGAVRPDHNQQSQAQVVWGGPAAQFCSRQAHAMEMISFPDNRAAVFFTDRTPPSADAAPEVFGNSLLYRVGDKGELTTLGNYRFADQAVVRLKATMLTPTSFAIGCRSAKAVDELSSSTPVEQEALAVYGELGDMDLVFDPNPLSLEPNTKGIWARGVGKITNTSFGYAYHLGNEQQTKLAIVKVDPATKRMNVTGPPAIIHTGDSTPYVSMLSTPYSDADPHTMVLYEVGSQSHVNFCSVKDDSLQDCEESPWMKVKVSSVKGIPLSGGRGFFVFTTMGGVPYYTTVGIAKK